MILSPPTDVDKDEEWQWANSKMVHIVPSLSWLPYLGSTFNDKLKLVECDILALSFDGLINFTERVLRSLCNWAGECLTLGRGRTNGQRRTVRLCCRRFRMPFASKLN